MAKTSKTRIIGRGVDEVNLPKETKTTNLINIPATVDTSAAANTELLKSYQNYGAVSGSPTGQLATSSQSTQNPVTGTTTKSYQQSFTPSAMTNSYLTKMQSAEANRPDDYEEPEFELSDLTNRYLNRMQDTEDNKPAAYQSKYEDTINQILDTINNRKAFDVTSDANYNALYDQYAERYKAQAQRSMNDAMASANAATGGYGSTYGQAVGQQAYDRTMEGLNDQNMALMNLAYQIYEGDRANDYNKLNAYQSQDNTMYGRYRDDVNDWQTDRNYYAGQYQQNYANDRSAFENDRSFGYNQYRDNMSDYLNDRNYYAGQYWNSYGTDRSAYDTDRTFDYTMDQNEIQRDDANYQDALKQAMSLAQAGLPVPDYITARINQYNEKYGLGTGLDTTAYLQQLAALATMGSGSSGGSGRGKGKGGGDDTKIKMTLHEGLRALEEIYENEGYNAAIDAIDGVRETITSGDNIDSSINKLKNSWRARDESDSLWNEDQVNRLIKQLSTSKKS